MANRIRGVGLELVMANLIRRVANGFPGVSLTSTSSGEPMSALQVKSPTDAIEVMKTPRHQNQQGRRRNPGWRSEPA